ncbi:hypothetical protein ACG9ZL_19585 [Acinetobacter sp. ULE_I057]|uniref:hypothetical protein n=1 Tax=Acinetobacter sp. ULE_I057 TaxID=3373070 RepID=UPI003AF76746
MDIKEIETLKAEIERFKTEFRGTFVYDNLLLTLTDDQIFDYLSIKNNRVMFNKHQTRQMWDLWQSAKATPEGFVLVPKQPTPKMIDATWNFDEEIQDMSHNSRNEFIYNAMIAAAQEPTND